MFVNTINYCFCSNITIVYCIDNKMREEKPVQIGCMFGAIDPYQMIDSYEWLSLSECGENHLHDGYHEQCFVGIDKMIFYDDSFLIINNDYENDLLAIQWRISVAVASNDISKKTYCILSCARKIS
jgi:hypothetical protein